MTASRGCNLHAHGGIGTACAVRCPFCHADASSTSRDGGKERDFAVSFQAD